MFLKRILLFGLVNILIVITISTVLGLLGIQPYLTQKGIDYQNLFYFCLVWGMGGSIISLLLSKFLAKKFMGVQVVDENSSYRDLVMMVHRLSQQAGLTKMPEVGVYDSPDLNAFATGPTKNNSIVAVSTGLLSRMNRDEIEGVLGHEVAHIANGDMVTLTLIQGVVNAFVMFFARVATFAIDQMLRGDDENEKGLGYFAHHMVVMLFEMVFGILGIVVVSFFSRWREFRADAGSAKIAGKHKMIKALRALQQNYGIKTEGTEERPEFQSFKISSKRSWFALFSTHPPLEKRIEALEHSQF